MPGTADAPVGHAGGEPLPEERGEPAVRSGVLRRAEREHAGPEEVERVVGERLPDGLQESRGQLRVVAAHEPAVDDRECAEAGVEDDFVRELRREPDVLEAGDREGGRPALLLQENDVGADDVRRVPAVGEEEIDLARDGVVLERRPGRPEGVHLLVAARDLDAHEAVSDVERSPSRSRQRRRAAGAGLSSAR